MLVEWHSFSLIVSFKLKLKFVINEVMDAQSIYDPISLTEIMRKQANIACETSFKKLYYYYDIHFIQNIFFLVTT